MVRVTYLDNIKKGTYIWKNHKEYSGEWFQGKM